MSALLDRVLSGGHLDESEAAELLGRCIDEAAPPALAGALLAALRAKGETPAELRGFALAMRRIAVRPALSAGPPIVDTVGTGGDRSGSLNLSTGTALLAAALGQRVAKHGNRAVSSRSGSADVIEALGLPMDLDPDEAGYCLARTGFTFLFAPRYHPAMRVIAPVRRALGVRTIFNLLGPITNPADPPYQLVGAYSLEAAALLAETLSGMPIRRAFVVHGAGGWDEATPAGTFALFDVAPGRVGRIEVDPGDYALPRCSLDALAGTDAAENAVRLEAVFGGERGAHRDALVLGAALVLQLTGEVTHPGEAARAAAAAIDDGRAARLLARLRTLEQARRVTRQAAS